MSNAYDNHNSQGYSSVRRWVEDLPREGRFTFSLADAQSTFPCMPIENIQNALFRLSAAQRICSVWRGFYAIMLPEYGFQGNIPPTEYIDQLMSYRRADYYIGLLTAASYQGASHQAPQVFQVITNPQIRSKELGNSRLDFVYKKNMPTIGIETMVVKSGYINVSSPALTALDLVRYYSRAGGIAHVTEVLSELAESIDFATLGTDVFLSEPKTVSQRLGFILQHVLDEATLADTLYERLMQAGIVLQRTKLMPGITESDFGYDKRWNVVVNYLIEVEQ